MKILITTDAYSNIVNGVAISVKNLYNALKSQGHDVRILTLSDKKGSYKADDVYYIKSSAIKIYPDARATLSFHDRLLKDILAWNPDIVHSQCEFSTFIFAKRIASRLNIPVVHTYHTLYEYYTHYFCPNKAAGKKIVAAGSRFICNKTNAVIAPTEKTAKILKRYKVDAPIRVIPTGLSLEHLSRPVSDDEINSLKVSLNIPSGAPVLITVGRLAKEKNTEQLIRFMANPDLRARGFMLVIAGDGPYKAYLEQLTMDLGLQDCIRFTGLIAPDQVYKYYRLGDIFVSASSSETQGLTYIEAMTCERPLVCFKDDCLSSILTNGFNGFQFITEGGFAEAVKTISSDKALSEQMARHSKSIAEQFSNQLFARRVYSLYCETIAQFHVLPVRIHAPLASLMRN